MLDIIFDHLVDIFEIILPTVLIYFNNITTKVKKVWNENKHVFNLIIFILLLARTMYKYFIQEIHIEEVNILLKIITSILNILYVSYKIYKS